MSKEQILHDNCDVKVLDVLKAEEFYKNQMLITVPQALKAMDEHAEIIAVEFNEWIHKNAYKITPNGMYYHKDDLFIDTLFSVKELFKKFKPVP